ncbi:MAG: biopolymer transporter ExbD [Planctomycetes bacterium]|nr:biopolymer transporter ExbD [Planctomycetota bacterium]
MARKSRRQLMKEEVTKEVEIDMTPMIDVVFLLIIFFLCIDFKILESKLPAYYRRTRAANLRGSNRKSSCGSRSCSTARGEEPPPGGQARPTTWSVTRVHYTVGPKKVETLDELKDELKKIHDDPNRRVPDPKKPGSKKVMGVVIEPDTGTVYGDVAPCVDAVKFVGFDDINFGGGLGSETGGKMREEAAQEEEVVGRAPPGPTRRRTAGRDASLRQVGEAGVRGETGSSTFLRTPHDDRRTQ